MSMSNREEHPVDLPGAADEEDISRADAVRRVDEDPEEQRNYTDRPLVDRDLPEDS
jgi:hypothetical protein